MSALVLCYFIKVMECISSAIRELFELTYLDSAWCLVRIALKLIRFRDPSYIGLKSGAGYSSSQLQQLQGFQNSRNLHRVVG